ncbi:hypothetical protein ABMA27_002946 [Loxostege sticticalis]|uniref:Reverse transcriptase domain-containing protein n=1 Tax=Loxostege sticticalis TaxID=481309 RepID=A0ABR3HRI4_LOXSC
MNILGFKQYNGIKNAFRRTLDLVFCNDIVCVSDSTKDPLVPIDLHHGALAIDLQFADFTPLTRAPYVQHIFSRGDYDSINAEISGNLWQKEFSSRSLQDAVEYFYTFINSLIEKYIPSKLITAERFPVWYSSALKKCIKEKYKFLRKFKNYGNRSDEESFKLLRDRVKTLEQSCYRNYVNSVENALRDNPKKFWSFIKAKSKTNVMPSSLSYCNSVFYTGDSICNAFSDYFASNFLNSSSSSPNFNFSTPEDQTVSDIASISVDAKEVAKLLLGLDPSKSAGPDFLPARFLINCAETIAIPISLLFKRSLAEGIVPNIWKRAFITPVHKKGSRADVTNYRPISKLCIVSKVFEKIVYSQLYSALQQSFTVSQHGFLKGRSTVSNLVLLNSYLTEAMDSGSQVDVVYTDYSKAFDRIQHNLLLRKLQRIGISGDLLRWFSSYIDNRSQAVVVNNYLSGWVTVPSGVPQGSLLGPLLFVIFVNDIEHCFHSSHLLCFADDMKIFATITSEADAVLLQEDLARLSDYCVENHLDLNASKCSVVTFSRKRILVSFDYKLKGVNLQRESIIRDLGVCHDSKLLFDTHINYIISKASKALGFVMRNSKDFTQIKTLKILYCALVRSNLEYASQVWNPRYQTYISRIENIQKRFIKYVCFRNNERYDSSQYLDFCKKHHLLPLEIRREIADMMFLLRISSGSIDCPELLSQVGLRAPTKPLRYNPLIYLPPSSSNYRQNTFIWRASNNFNMLSKKLNLDLFNTSNASVKRLMGQLFFNG